MNAFDYLFSFYGLLLGIAVANVAIGFADMWRDCEKIQVGGCPPLLCGIVLLGGMNVWLTMWHIRGLRCAPICVHQPRHVPGAGEAAGAVP